MKSMVRPAGFVGYIKKGTAPANCPNFQSPFPSSPVPLQIQLAISPKRCNLILSAPIKKGPRPPIPPSP